MVLLALANSLEFASVAVEEAAADDAAFMAPSRALAPDRPTLKAAEIIKSTLMAKRWLKRSRDAVQARTNTQPQEIFKAGSTTTSAPSSTKWLKIKSSMGTSIAERLQLVPDRSLVQSLAEKRANEEFFDKGEDSAYFEQADEAMHSGVAWKLRVRLRRHPWVTRELQRFTDVLYPEGQDAIKLDKYTKLQLCLYKALVEPFSEKDARKCARADWEQDCKGAPTLSREGAEDSLFEMCDVRR